MTSTGDERQTPAGPAVRAGGRLGATDASGMAIRGVVFSRDRAMQLEATLTSLSRNCAEAEALRIDVLYTATSPALARQYEVLERTWGGALRLRFHRERDFRGDLLEILGPVRQPSRGLARLPARVIGALSPHRQASARTGGPGPFVLLLVDDNIFCRPFSLAAAVGALAARPRAIGFSLRLGRDTGYCYTRDSRQRVPELSAVGDDVVAFDWTTADDDFGYPLEVSSSIYDGPGLARLFAGLRFSNPNTLEARFAAQAKRPWARRTPELLCFERSVAFCNAVNKVQTVYDNRAGARAELSAAELAKRFDEGLRIDTGAFAGFVPDACHCDVPFSFIPRETATADARADARADAVP